MHHTMHVLDAPTEGSKFRIEGPPTENERRCVVEVFTRGTNGSQPEEERSLYYSARRPTRTETGRHSSCE